MKKRNLFMLAVVVFSNILIAKHADDFPIATYFRPSEFPGEYNTIIDYTRDAKFNLVLAQELDDSQINYADDSFIDVIHKFSPSIHKISKCNKWNFEAEYYKYSIPNNYQNQYTGNLGDIHTDVILPDDWPETMYYYAFDRDFEEEVIPKQYVQDDNSENYIICEPGIGEGLVVDALRYHSIPTDILDYDTDWEQKDHLYGNIQKSYSGYLTSYKISYKMNIPQIHSYSDPNTIVCKVGLKVLRYNPADSTFSYDFVQFPGESENLISVTYQDFVESYAVGSAFQDVKTFEVTKNFIENLNGHWAGGLVLCPVIWYCDNGELNVDSVGIIDNVAEELGDIDSSPIADIYRTHAQNLLSTHDNIFAFAAADELREPSFWGHKKVKEILTAPDVNSNLIGSIAPYGLTYSQYFGYPLHNASKTLTYIAEPTNILLQRYPITASSNWNDVPDNTFTNKQRRYNMQAKLNLMLNIYRDTKLECLDKNIKFYPIVQMHGSRTENTSGGFNWGLLKPPNETQQALCYLPLCYGADGIFYFNMENTGSTGTDLRSLDGAIHNSEEELFDSSRGHSYYPGLINYYDNEWVVSPQYSIVKEANREIKVIGSIIKDLTWDTSKTLTLMPDPVTISLFNSVSVEAVIKAFDPSGIGINNSNGDEYDEGYQGYVDCSVYNDGINDYFMLVNRRGNFPKSDCTYESSYCGTTILKQSSLPLHDTNIPFVIAESQTVHFEFDGQIPDNYALVDQYDGTLYNDFTYSNDKSEIDVIIEAGEAMLLEFRDIVTFTEIIGTVSLANCYIAEDITIRNNGILNIGENVTVGANVTLINESGANLNLNGEIKFCIGSKISNLGELHIGQSSSTLLTSRTNNWRGIQSIAGSTTIIQNSSIIENAECGIVARNCDVQVINSTFRNCLTGIDISSTPMSNLESNFNFISSNISLPPIPNAIGINISDSPYTDNILITNGSLDNSLITGTNRKGIGVKIHASVGNSNLICENTIFAGLETGILHEPYRFTSHQIKQCEFDDCINGIQVLGNGILYKIEDNNFINNEIGLNIDTAITQVFDNKFDNNITGINLANTHSYRTSLISKDYVIDGNKFGYYNGLNGTDIIVCDSSPRISNSIFKSATGLLNTNNSNVDLSYSANNVFDCTYVHINFIPDETIYSSTIQLAKGHNDFYENESYDFRFERNYENSLPIDANYNWWEDDNEPIFVDTFGPAPQIIVDYLDSDPNVTFSPSPNNRYETAVNEELQGNFEVALDMYKVILYDFNIAEFENWHNCVDKIYKLYLTVNGDMPELIVYYESCYNSIPESLSAQEIVSLQSLFVNYRKKCYIQNKQYQPAADIVVEKISNSISPVDSLFAVMELETIYTLSEKDSLNRSAKVSTELNHFAPKSTFDFNKKQKDHWSEIYSILGITIKTEEDYTQEIPTIPTLYNNYPNPFNPETNISFSIPENSKAKISIYNIKGQKVKNLLNENLEKGHHSVIWHSKDNSGKTVASGVYFFQLEVNEKTQDIRKCLLLK